ncbi:hypothetical protein FRB94_008480 [Tulasnella sp. JGI-2019a]|nr:hypothetical protein FRB93_010854 [Tulasnella sp. JGI-2019a]KAG9011409.1 hypothetical protein FRB94_008480 [Tulasnella sp. JGI-2019a]
MGLWQHVFGLTEIWTTWMSAGENGRCGSAWLCRSGLGPLDTSYSLTFPPSKILPESGNALWYRKPAAGLASWSMDWLPIGNGYLGAMIAGGTHEDYIQINIDSFWSGGPLVNSSYNGGNPGAFDASSINDQLDSIRQDIFRSKDGVADSIGALTVPPLNYGSFSGAGYLMATRNNTHRSSGYLRWLDLDSGVLKSTWSEGDIDFHREYFCSHNTKSCTAYTKASSLPSHHETSAYSYSFLPLHDLHNPTATCLDATTLRYRGQSHDRGMTFEFLAQVHAQPPTAHVTCRTSVAKAPGGKDVRTTSVIEIVGALETWVTWVGDTNYDIEAGDEAHGFSFTGPDPHRTLVKSLSGTTQLSYVQLRQTHLSDFKTNLTDKFSLSLGASPDFSRSTDEQVREYTRRGGNPHLEWVLFNFGRYLLFTSGRGVLPANLQGVWAQDTRPAWSADYHANINTQMNYWAAEIMDVDVTASLWTYMEKTWVPRGQQTAKILYNTTRGWVTHNEMNIFGHTGMKSWGPWDSSFFANYPASGAWMMSHVIDHFEYGSGSISWWKKQGWPLVKGVAEFWLDNLFVDEHHKDGTMVVNPCNSPEQAPVTLGCAHFQQLIWELFNGIEKGWEYSSDNDVAFLAEVRSKNARLDRGLHIGRWGQLQEWKVDKDSQTDLHRHLSHLVGLYPSYSIASYPEGGATALIGLTREALLDAARESLIARGDGKGPDADAGWEKVWRAACWAQLGHAEKFYDVLKYAVATNFGFNLFSLYDPFTTVSPIFQIDANLAYPAVLLNALIQSPSKSSLNAPLAISLLPALPAAWARSGEIKNARVRGGCSVDFSWRNGRLDDVIVIKCDRWLGPSQRILEIWEGVEGTRLIGRFKAGKDVVQRIWVSKPKGKSHATD